MHAPSNEIVLKYTSLVVLTFQNAAQVLLMRYARTRITNDMFLSTSAVFCTEVVKLSACLIVIYLQEFSASRAFKLICDNIIRKPFDTLKICIPSLIYTAQNNLLYVAVSNLESATFMVSVQLKIFTTALFSVAMLRKKLSSLQWFALVLLFTGVSVIQLERVNEPTNAKLTLSSTNQTHSLVEPITTTRNQSAFIGFVCVISCAVLSGFSGVYFEMILKGGADVTIWIRNVQLAVLGIPMSFITMYSNDYGTIKLHGIFYGYDYVVWGIIMLYALGGLTVGVVVKYADNILKGFATSISILISCIASVYFFNFRPSFIFMVGTALVITAVLVYSKFVPSKPRQETVLYDTRPVRTLDLLTRGDIEKHCH